MKKIITLILLFFTITLKADPIDAVEKWKAEKIASYLKDEKFIFEYCDCCGDKLKVVSVESVSIEPADAKLYSVRVRGRVVYEFDTDVVGNLKNVQPKSELFNSIISINYTFIQQNAKAFTIDNVLNLGEWVNESCQYFVDLPSPENLASTSNTKYFDWYYKTVSKDLNPISKLIGSWNINMINNKSAYVENKVRYKFKSDNTYFTNMGQGTTGKYWIEKGMIVMKDDDTKETFTIPFYIEEGRLHLKIEDKKDGLLLYYLLKE
jgi:hypothetical protein